MRKLLHEEILARQQDWKSSPKVPVTVVLNNIRSLYNVGSIFRTSDGAGIEKVWICGITGFPPNSQISKTALGSEDSVLWEYHSEVSVVVKNLKESGYQIVLLEQAKESISYCDFQPKFPTCLILGNEVSGVDDSLIDLADECLEIPMAGMKNSLNVSVAYGIMAYEMGRRFRLKDSV